MENTTLAKPTTASEWVTWAENATIQELIESGDAFECPVCDALNIYSPALVDRFPEAGMATGSCFETTCGTCRATFVERDSPILAECYSHLDFSAMEED